MSAAPTGSSGKYAVERAEFPRDRERAVNLWRGNLGDPTKVESKFTWFYEASPTGRPLALFLTFRDGNGEAEAVGVAAAGLRAFALGDRSVPAGVLVDMAVVPRHRTLFPALMLQKSMREAGVGAGLLLYGFPNPKAAPVFQRAGYRRLGMMTRYVRVLRAADYLVGRVPKALAFGIGAIVDVAAGLRFGVGRSSGVSLRWDSLTDPISLSDGGFVSGRPLFRGARDEQFLRWRFAGNRGRTFGVVNAVGGADAAAIGFWIVEAEAGVLQVRDCAVGLLMHPLAAQAWNALFVEARKRGYRSVSFECMAPRELVGVIHRIGMLPRSQRPAFVGGREDQQPTISADDSYLTAADEDE